MKLTKICFLMLFLLLPAGFAQSQIFSGKVLTGTDKVVEGDTFRFVYDEGNKKAFVQTPATNLIIENGACKSNDFFRVCINSANLSFKNLTTYVDYYDVDVTIYKFSGNLSAAGSISASTLLQNELAEFSITITNPSDFYITNIDFVYDFLNFSVSNVKGCDLDGSSIKWKGSLKSKYDKTCSATLYSDKAGMHTLSGSLSYFNSFKQEKIATSLLSVTVLPKQLKIYQWISNNTEVREPFHVNMSLQNLHSTEKINGRVTIELPDNFTLLENPRGFVRDSGVLTQNLIMEPGSFVNYSMHLKALSLSDAPIRQKFDYTIKGVGYMVENSTFLSLPEPGPVVSLVSEYDEVSLGQKVIVVAKIANPSLFHELTGIKARLSTNYNEVITQNISRLFPGESYTIISSTLAIPKSAEFLNGSNIVRIELCIEYIFNGDARYAKKALEIKVKEASDSNKTSQQAAAEPQVTAAQSLNDSKSQANLTLEEIKINPRAKVEELFKTAVSNPKSIVEGHERLILGPLIAIVFLIVTFVIVRAGRRRRKIQDKTPDGSDNQDKPKNF